jgi:phage N-6-adenine-methyltransferase
LILSKAHCTSDNQDWETPIKFVRFIERIYDVTFVLDVAASDSNHICDDYFKKENSAFENDWVTLFRPKAKHSAIFCNPPYSDKACPVSEWIDEGKGYILDAEILTTFPIFYLLPINKQDQPWFHRLLNIKDIGVNFGIVKGRIQYLLNGKIPLREDKKNNKWVKSSNSQGSMIIAMGRDIEPGIRSLDWCSERKINGYKWPVESELEAIKRVYGDYYN